MNGARIPRARLSRTLERGPGPWLAWPILVALVALLVLTSTGMIPRPLASVDGAGGFQATMERGYHEGWFTAWIRRPDRLDDHLDLDATRGFVTLHLGERSVNQVNLVCAAYQLGMDPGALPGWHGGQPWRAFWRHDLWPFGAYYLLNGRDPAPAELEGFRAYSELHLDRLLSQGVPAGWRQRHDLVRTVMALRLAGAWPHPAHAATLEAWARGVPHVADSYWDPFVDAQLCGVADLDCDLGALRGRLESSWDGARYPDEDCGTGHCATKLLITAVQLHHLLDWPIERERCEGWLAGLVALQNPDGSMRTGLDDPRDFGVLDTVQLYHCGSFCQLHLWETINAMSVLVDRCAPDPTAVAHRVAGLRGEEGP